MRGQEKKKPPDSQFSVRVTPARAFKVWRDRIFAPAASFRARREFSTPRAFRLAGRSSGRDKEKREPRRLRQQTRDTHNRTLITHKGNKRKRMKTARAATMILAVLCLGLLSCAVSASEHGQHANRKLLQLQQPWLRLPAYETINPFRIASKVGQQFASRLTFGFLPDQLTALSDGIANVGWNAIEDIGTANNLGK